MDRNACLDAIRRTAKRILANSESNGPDVNDASDLAELVHSLDDWISSDGFLPDDWQHEGATTLHRFIKGDTLDYKNIVWKHPRYGFYVEVYWRRGDMPWPTIDASLFGGKNTPEEVRIQATLLRAAAAEADRWVAKADADAGTFWTSSLKE